MYTIKGLGVTAILETKYPPVHYIKILYYTPFFYKEPNFLLEP